MSVSVAPRDFLEGERMHKTKTEYELNKEREWGRWHDPKTSQRDGDSMAT